MGGGGGGGGGGLQTLCIINIIQFHTDTCIALYCAIVRHLAHIYYQGDIG